MASSLKSLGGEYSTQNIKDISDKKFGVVVSEYHGEITEALFDGVKQTLLAEGAKEENIIKKYVPGAYELTLGAQWLAAKQDMDAVITLGCVVLGETKHFDFICNAVANGITTVGLQYNKPVIFGVLTPNDYQQAKDRAGGKHGNKGVEAAVAAIKMLGF